MKAGYGKAPIDLGKFDLAFPEMMFYLYLPVKMAGVEFNTLDVPRNLRFVVPILRDLVVKEDDYVYITAKNMWYEPGGTYNRTGWHTDGFMSDDKNYIWCDTVPTEFIEATNLVLYQDHARSMAQMQQYVDDNHLKVYSAKPKHFLELDEFVIHQPPRVLEAGMRGFIKISVSKDKYNLVGNSHNHLIDYNWAMCDRKATRNHPICEVKQ